MNNPCAEIALDTDPQTRRLRKAYTLAQSYGASRTRLQQMLGALAVDDLDTSVWVTKSGDVLPLKDMTEFHIKSCIKMIECKPGWRTAWLVPLKKELTRRNTKLGEVIYGND